MLAVVQLVSISLRKRAVSKNLRIVGTDHRIAVTVELCFYGKPPETKFK